MNRRARIIALVLAADCVLAGCADTAELEAQSLARSRAFCAAAGKQFLWHHTNVAKSLLGPPDVTTEGSCVAPGERGYATAVSMNPVSANAAASEVASSPATRTPTRIATPVSGGNGHNCADRFYPPIAVRLKQEGTVRVRVTVEGDGSVSGETVVSSSGFDSLDRATVKCLKDWHYRPATLNGEPIAAQTETSVVWTLRQIRNAR